MIMRERLVQHNSGKTNFTSKGIPWELIKAIGCVDRPSAVQLELKIKGRGIKRYLEQIK